MPGHGAAACPGPGSKDEPFVRHSEDYLALNYAVLEIDRNLETNALEQGDCRFVFQHRAGDDALHSFFARHLHNAPH